MKWLVVILRAAVGHDIPGALARVVIAVASALLGAELLADPPAAPSESSWKQPEQIQSLDP